MTNTYSLSNSLNPSFETALMKVTAALDDAGLTYFIAGATARDVMLHGVFGHEPIRATQDIDTAIYVSDWTEFESARQSLIEAGLKETQRIHRLREPKTGLPIDIIPFGKLADEKGHIQWPPKYVETMSVVGFREAFDSALTIEHKDLCFKVASLPGIALMKLTAWDERGDENSKDATDFFTIMDKYQLIHDGRMWEEYVPAEQWDYDMEKSAAFLLGFDVRDLLSEATTAVLWRIKEEKQDALISAIARTHKAASVDEVEEKLNVFWLGSGV